MTVVESVGWVLLHFVWQGAAVAAALWVALALATPARATLRYGLGCGALLLMLAAPIVTALTLTTGGRPSPVTLGATSFEPATVRSMPPELAAVQVADQKPSSADHVSRSASPAGRLVLGSSWRTRVDAALPWLVACWAAGVMLLSVRLLGGWWRTRALRTMGVSPVPAAYQALLTRLSERMGVTRSVTLTASVRVAVPVVLGHVRPLVLLPAAALAGLSTSQLEAILAHELAHVRRHDYLVNLVQTVIETLLFYHPAVWWVSREVRLAREHCCDDLAVAACGDRKGYVEALLGLEQLRQPSALLALGATDGPLLARARRVLTDAERQAATPRLAASAIALTVAALAIAGVSTASEKPAIGDASITQESRARVEGQPALRKAVAAVAEGQAVAQPPVSVVTTPEPAAALAARWTWGEREARTRNAARYWIGYSVVPVSTLPPLVYMDRSGTIVGNHMTFSGHVFSSGRDGLTFPGRTLQIATVDGRAIKLLFELDASGGSPRLTRVHGSTMALPVDVGDRPVFWLGQADSAQSLERIDALYSRASSVDIKNDLVGAAGVHDNSPAVVAWLEGRLAGSDPDDLRADAAEWIAWHPISAALTALDRTARTDRASRVRQEAAEALGDLALPQATDTLIALARSLQDLDARREAVEALGARPELAARDALATIAREDKSLDIQREAVETLGDYKDQRGVPLLMDLARTHPNADVRREAVETLGEALPKETAVPLLKQLALEDPDPGVQEEAVDTLADVDDATGLATLIELAQSHPGTQVRREAVEALAHRAPHAGETAVAAGELTTIVNLLARLAESDRELDVQVEAVETLGEIADPRAVERLRVLAETHAKPEVRREAIETLTEHASGPDAIAVLQEVIRKDADEGVRLEAVERLAEVHEPGGRAALVELTRTHADERVRAEAVESLGEAPPSTETAELLRGIALNDRSPRVRDEAVETLADLPDGAGVPALIELARTHPDKELRKRALEALVDSDHPRAREVFERALQKPPSR